VYPGATGLERSERAERGRGCRGKARGGIGRKGVAKRCTKDRPVGGRGVDTAVACPSETAATYVSVRCPGPGWWLRLKCLLYLFGTLDGVIYDLGECLKPMICFWWGQGGESSLTLSLFTMLCRTKPQRREAGGESEHSKLGVESF